MDQAGNQSPSEVQNPGGFRDGAGGVLDVHEPHVADHDIETGVPEHIQHYL